MANAVLKSMRVISLGDTRAAMALPDSPHHRREVALLRAALTLVGIGVFWVDSATSEVTLGATWSLQGSARGETLSPQ